ncbi:MAG: 50S ribosomal protein L21 [Planctomycetota bacterium]
MYAVIQDSGRQFRVTEGDVLDVDLRDLADDAKQVEFDNVLLIADEGDVKIGTPLLDGAKVTAEIVEAEFKGPKVHTYRWRRRKNSRRKTGHRQKYVRVKVSKIEA